MFSENQKISGRQTTRLLIYDIMGISTLLLPPMLARIAGGDGFFCIFLALIPAYLFLGIIQKVRVLAGTDYLKHIRYKTGRVIGGLLLLLYYLSSVMVAGYALYLMSRLVNMQLLKNEPYALISISILLLGGYGIMGGIEGRARIYEILFWFLMLPLLLMLLLAVKDVNADYWTPVFSCGWQKLLQGTAVVFLFYILVYFVLFLFPFEKKQGQGIISAKKALCISACLNGLIYLITLGIFGRSALAEMDHPVITLMSMIKIPGGFFERQDAFMVAIWFFALYALVNSGMFYGTDCLKRLIQRKGNKRYILVTLCLTFAFSTLFYLSPSVWETYKKYLVYYGAAFLILIPLLFSLGKKRKIGTMLLLVFFMTCGLTGCSSVELEKRNFPLAIALDEDAQGCSVTLGFQDLSEIADQNVKQSKSEPAPVKEPGWYEAFTTVASNQPGTMDYNHLKVLILQNGVLDDKESLTEFLDYINRQEMFSRNTLLYASEDTAFSVIGMDENLELPVGTYLEQMTEGQKEQKKKAVVTLGSLLNEEYNRQENLYIPIITSQDGKPVITKYYVLSSFQSVGVVDEDTFLTAMLFENKLNTYQFQMDTGESVELTHISTTYEVSQKNDKCLEKIKIKAEARLQNRDIADKEEQQELEKNIREYLELKTQTLAGSNLTDKNLDISNSYYRLGGYNRKLYTKYFGKQEAYQKNLEYAITCEIKLIDE